MSWQGQSLLFVENVPAVLKCIHFCTVMSSSNHFSAAYCFWFLFLDARDRLKKIKEERLRRSDEVVQLWEDVLSNNARKLGDEGRGNIPQKVDWCVICALHWWGIGCFLVQFGRFTSKFASPHWTAIDWTFRDSALLFWMSVFPRAVVFRDWLGWIWRRMESRSFFSF